MTAPTTTELILQGHVGRIPVSLRGAMVDGKLAGFTGRAAIHRSLNEVVGDVQAIAGEALPFLMELLGGRASDCRIESLEIGYHSGEPKLVQVSLMVAVGTARFRFVALKMMGTGSFVAGVEAQLAGTTLKNKLISELAGDVSVGDLSLYYASQDCREVPYFPDGMLQEAVLVSSGIPKTGRRDFVQGLNWRAEIFIGGTDLLDGIMPTQRTPDTNAATPASIPPPEANNGTAEPMPALADADVTWVPINRTMGPLQLRQIGFGIDLLKKGSPLLELRLQGALRLSCFELDLIDAGITAPLLSLSDITFGVRGLGVAFKLGGLSIAGEFLKVSEAEYAGALRGQCPAFAFGAIGIYGNDDRGTTLFVCGVLNASGAAGIRLGPMTITGFAFGLGVNRRLLAPKDVQDIGKFPLVQLAMGNGPNTVEPSGLLETLHDYLPREAGQYFGCFGVKFKIAESVDGFVLAVAQFGNDLDFCLLGLARFEKKNICFVELAIKCSLRPSEGVFLAQAELTRNSWVLDKDCKLTGGFALGVWFDGPNKGDFVLSVGGYHPRFRKPLHYPLVPRLGLNWQVTRELSLKGELYCAITPSTLMAGARLEAVYASGWVQAWFVAHVDFLMEWAPLHYEVEAGIAIRVRASTFLRDLDFSVAVMLQIHGPPFGGRAEIEVSVVSFEIEFGEPKRLPPPIEAWSDFGSQFLDKQSARPTWEIEQGTSAFVESGPSLCAFNLRSGEASGLQANSEQSDGSGPARTWFVRADELEFSVSSMVPITRLETIDRLNPAGDELAAALRDTDSSGRDLKLVSPMKSASSTPWAKTGACVGIRPMGIASLSSTTRIGVFAGPDCRPINLDGWTFDEERMAMPSALWDTSARGDRQQAPEVKLIKDCITGLGSVRSPRGRLEERGCVELAPPLLADSLAALIAKVPGAANTDVSHRWSDGSAPDADRAATIMKTVDQLLGVSFLQRFPDYVPKAA